MSSDQIIITKMTGEKVLYIQSKLRRSLKKSGATDDVIAQVIEQIEAALYDGMSTKEIYKRAFNLLKKDSTPTAARYKLKKAIMELGPTGYPFEKFVGAILAHQGFSTRVGVIVQGQCVSHEVDVIAEKDNEHFMIECKFHGQTGRFCNVKIPLYIQSRFLDVEKQWSKKKGHASKFHQGWIFTNTRFTTDAMQYGKCAGLMLVSWDYPENDSLKNRIDVSGLHPITCLTTLTKKEKQSLLVNEVVLCKELCADSKLLEAIGISEKRRKKILNEASVLCKITAHNLAI